jgi:hypothetical protein
MAHVNIRVCLLMVGLSAVVCSGCTRFDTRISGQRWRDNGHNPSETPLVVASTSPDHGEVEPPLDTPEPTLDELFLETVPSNTDEVEAVLNELDATLLMLENLLGSTKHWDVAPP